MNMNQYCTSPAVASSPSGESASLTSWVGTSVCCDAEASSMTSEVFVVASWRKTEQKDQFNFFILILQENKGELIQLIFVNKS